MHERIAKLEVTQEAIHSTLTDHVTQEDADKKEILAEIRCIKTEQSKQKGFIAGVSAAVSAIIIAVGMALKWLGQ